MRKRNFKYLELEQKVTLERLEDRIVLDASVDSANCEDGEPDQSHEGQSASAGDSAESQDPQAVPGQGAEEQNPLDTIFDEDINLVLISNEVDQIDSLSEAVVDDAQIIVYDADQDSLGDINSILYDITDSGAKSIGHIAILAHGGPGVMGLADLGPVQGESRTIASADLVALSQILTDDARIDLYGCNTGSAEPGEKLVDYLASTTDAIVWASDDLTGAGDQRDWDLEVRSGPSERGFLIDHQSLEGSGIELAFMPGPTAGGGDPDYSWNSMAISYNEAISGNQIRLTFNDISLIDAGLDALTLEAFADLDGKAYTQGQGVYYENSVNETLLLYGEDQSTLLAEFGDLGRFNFYVWEDVSIPEAKWDAWTQDGNLDLFISFSGQVEQVDRAYGWVFDAQDQTEPIGENLGYYGWPNFVALQMSWSKNPISSEGLTDIMVPVGSDNTVINLDQHFQAPEGSDLTYSLVNNDNQELFDSVNIDNGSNMLEIDYRSDVTGASLITVRATLNPDDIFNPIYLDESFSVIVNPVNETPQSVELSRTSPVESMGPLTNEPDPAGVLNPEIPSGHQSTVMAGDWTASISANWFWSEENGLFSQTRGQMAKDGAHFNHSFPLIPLWEGPSNSIINHTFSGEKNLNFHSTGPSLFGPALQGLWSDEISGFHGSTAKISHLNETRAGYANLGEFFKIQGDWFDHDRKILVWNADQADLWRRLQGINQDRIDR